MLGFPFMTVGLLAGAVVATERFGPTFFADPKVLLSLLMWVIYLVLLYTPLERRDARGARLPIWPALDLSSRFAPGAQIT